MHGRATEDTALTAFQDCEEHKYNGTAGGNTGDIMAAICVTAHAPNLLQVVCVVRTTNSFCKQWDVSIKFVPIASMVMCLCYRRS